MAYYVTIQNLIDSVKDLEISYRNLHTTATLSVNDGNIIVPYSSLIRKYRNYFTSTVVQAQMTEREIFKYRYKPKMLAYDLYKSTELWSAIMELNHMVSIIEFDVTSINLYDPKQFLNILNEVLILEGKLV